MATITSSGAGSGLNVSSLVSQLVAAERAPYDARYTKIDVKLTTELSAVSKLKGAMSSFQGALAVLKKPDTYAAAKVAVSDEKRVAASVTAQAVAGSYDVEISQLAKAARLGSAVIPGGAGAAVGTGTLTLTTGSDVVSVTLAEPANTLADLRDAINKAPGNGSVRATLVNAADGTRLVLSGVKTGLANALSVTATGGDGGLAQFAYQASTPGSMSVLSAAQDAIVSISGYEVRSASNTLDEAVEGLTLTVKEAEVGEVVTVTVAPDEESVLGKVKGFVSAYNTLATTMSQLRSYNAETKVAGPMLGDAMLRNIESQLRRGLADPVTGMTGNFTSLASLGITTAVNGTLSIDETKLKAAMGSDGTVLSRLFTGTGGLASRLDGVLGEHLATGGDIAAREAGITTRRKDLTKQQQALETRMVAIQARYTKQFNSLDSLLTQMQSTSSYLASQLSSSSSG